MNHGSKAEPSRGGRGVAFFLVVALAGGFVLAVPPHASEISFSMSVPVEELFAILGPGPLPPPHPIARQFHSRLKAATVEDAVDRCVEDNMAALDAPGATVAVILDGELLYEHGYGVKRRNWGDQVDADTVFRIGSVTKQMTAAVVMQQVELGRVELGAPVTRYVPEFALSGKWSADRITLWHLLTHTSAFPDHIQNGLGQDDGALSRWAAAQDEMELHALPGSFWNYSNPNFMLAGLVAERASGTPYRDLYRESLWNPAGMSNTTFDANEVIRRGNFSYGHYYDGEEDREYILSPLDNDFWASGPAGYAFSTAGDLVHWALLLMDGGGPVLSPASAAKMQERQVWTNYTPDLDYGFGIMADRYRGLDIRQHGGNVAGYGAYLLWVPERRFAVALLSNVTSSLTDAAYCVVDEVLQPPPAQPQDLSTDPSTWLRYRGHYDVTTSEAEAIDAEVFFDDGNFMITVTESANPFNTLTAELEQLYLDTFAFDADGNGSLDQALTFCSGPGKPAPVHWLRDRHAVGTRRPTPRRARRR